MRLFLLASLLACAGCDSDRAEDAPAPAAPAAAPSRGEPEASSDPVAPAELPPLELPQPVDEDLGSAVYGAEMSACAGSLSIADRDPLSGSGLSDPGEAVRDRQDMSPEGLARLQAACRHWIEAVAAHEPSTCVSARHVEVGSSGLLSSRRAVHALQVALSAPEDRATLYSSALTLARAGLCLGRGDAGMLPFAAITQAALEVLDAWLQQEAAEGVSRDEVLAARARLAEGFPSLQHRVHVLVDRHVRPLDEPAATSPGGHTLTPTQEVQARRAGRRWGAGLLEAAHDLDWDGLVARIDADYRRHDSRLSDAVGREKRRRELLGHLPGGETPVERSVERLAEDPDTFESIVLKQILLGVLYAARSQRDLHERVQSPPVR